MSQPSEKSPSRRDLVIWTAVRIVRQPQECVGPGQRHHAGACVADCEALRRLGCRACRPNSSPWPRPPTASDWPIMNIACGPSRT